MGAVQPRRAVSGRTERPSASSDRTAVTTPGRSADTPYPRAASLPPQGLNCGNRAFPKYAGEYMHRKCHCSALLRHDMSASPVRSLPPQLLPGSIWVGLPPARPDALTCRRLREGGTPIRVIASSSPSYGTGGETLYRDVDTPAGSPIATGVGHPFPLFGHRFRGAKRGCRRVPLSPLDLAWSLGTSLRDVLSGAHGFTDSGRAVAMGGRRCTACCVHRPKAITTCGTRA